MGLIRTFHPVGQGAFYTERHSFEKDFFTVVYDCGSATLNKQELERKVKSTFLKNETIDILFISHFHADHINGIDILKNHCDIKAVVLPLMHDKCKILIKVDNFVNGFNNTLLIDDPQSYFGKNVKIIYIRERDDDEQRSIDNNTDLDIPISELTESKEFESGTKFKIANNFNWVFIPFNYKYDAYSTVFEDALIKHGLTFHDIDTITKIFTHENTIIKAYNSVNSRLNETSMVLFSGKMDSDEIFFYNCYPRVFVKAHFFSSYIGCLYMGDVNLRRKNIISDLKNALGNFMDYVGTIQIPHHGSIDNFDSSILTENIRNAIFSYGTNNTYGHPSDKVIAESLANLTYPYFVTEKQTSIVIQVTQNKPM